ncbi:MAG: long-chain fatty acid--CoA ligase [Pseudomonadota bacterium]
MTRFTNIIAAFFATARRMGDGPCLHYKQGGRWRAMSWLETAAAVRRIAAGLIGLDLRRGDRVVICAPTSVEWTLADLSIMAAGAITVPVYPSLTAERISYIIRDSEPKALFVCDGPVRQHTQEAIRASGVRDIVIIAMHSFPSPLRGNSQVTPSHQGRENHERNLCSLGQGASAKEIANVDEIVARIGPIDDATYVYTSGTTGEQKGAILTHGNLLTEVESAQKVFDFASHEIGLVCLPLAHVLGRLMQFYQLAQGCQAAYAEGIEHLAANYLEVRPHFVCGVPRMLEKMVELLELKLENSALPVRRLFAWAKRVGSSRSGCIQQHEAVPLGLRIRFFAADLLFFRRIRTRLGGRMRSFICGGASLPEEIARFFHAAGLLVLEGYGLTETFAAATVNGPNDYRFGTVGKPLSGVDMKIAPDGEVLFRGPTVFKGYRNLPEMTREAFDAEGWFKTGDLGERASDGFLRITGRKKDILVTAGGKNVAPQMIETLMSASPYINHFLVYGDGRKYLTALVALNTEAALSYLGRQGLGPQAIGQLSGHPVIRKLIGEHIEKINKRLAPFETIKRFAIVEGDFSIATGELTPTLKVRRGFASEKYRSLLEALYKD